MASTFQIPAPPHDRRQKLRYGENPHQTGFYFQGPGSWIQEYPNDTSYNDLQNAYFGLEVLRILSSAGHREAAIVAKHRNLAGIGIGGSVDDAIGIAIECDPVGALEGLLVLSGAPSSATLEKMLPLKPAGLVIPSTKTVADNPVRIFKYDSQRLHGNALPVESRLLPDGSILRQDPPWPGAFLGEMNGVEYLPDVLADVSLAYIACTAVHTNSAVVVSGGGTKAIVAGQQDGVRAICSALNFVNYHHPEATGRIIAADGNFATGRLPIDLLISSGIRIIVAPGCSTEDQRAASALEERGCHFIRTGKRIFRH